MFKSHGKLTYDTESGYRMTIEIDQDLLEYYFSLIPKYYKAAKPRWPAHVTIVRPEKEIPLNLENWGKYNGELIEFHYEPYLFYGKGYFWLNVWCNRLEAIRKELGLNIISQYTCPPTGFTKCFHCTIGNTHY